MERLNCIVADNKVVLNAGLPCLLDAADRRLINLFSASILAVLRISDAVCYI